MRNRYVVCYDVAEPYRLSRTYKLMNGYGDPVQYSVFVCDLSGAELARLKHDLTNLLNLAEDRVLVIDTGPFGEKHMFAMGSALKGGREPAIVI